MGKGSTRRGRAEKAGGHWSCDPLFVRLSDEGRRELLCAQQVRAAMDDGELHPAVLLSVVTMPDRKIRAESVADMLREGVGCDELINRAMLPSEMRITLPAPAPRSVLTMPIPPPRPTAAVPRSHPIPQPIPQPNGSAPLVQRQAPRASKWRTVLKPTLIYGMPLAYCVLGIGFVFFVTGDPELTIQGIGMGLVWALLKTVGVLVGLFVWATAMFGSSRSDAALTVGLGVFAVATLFGATIAYSAGYSHLQDNQFASMDALVERCMDTGIVRGDHRIGALCRDGWNSGSTGNGTCSHHGGVLHWEYPETQTRSIAQCKATAERTRWN